MLSEEIFKLIFKEIDSQTYLKHLATSRIFAHIVQEEGKYFKNRFSKKIIGKDRQGLSYIYYELPNGNKHGYEIKHDGNKLIYEAHWDNGNKEGIERGFHRTGKIMFIRQYKDQCKHGREIYYYDTGQKKLVNHYKKGLLHGISEAWHEINDVEDIVPEVVEAPKKSYSKASIFFGTISRKNLPSPRMERIDDLTLTDFNISPRAKMKYIIHYEEGKKQGLECHWDENGYVKYQVSYYNDLKDSDEITYYPSGKVEEFVSWKGGVKHGKEIKNHPNNIQSYSVFWKNGLKEGSEKVYYPSGRPFSRVSWLNGMMHGLAEYFYDEDNKYMAICQWTHGIRTGYEEQWDEFGKRISFICWLNGKKVGTETQWMPDGTVKRITHCE
jgi:antitoxin component YwqK of YwqJK toxin-antitoxin module